MAKYNSGVKYNYNANSGGFMYNSAIYTIIFKLSETLKASENISNIIAKILINEILKAKDLEQLNALFKIKENFNLRDDVKANLFIEVVERLNISDIIKDVLVTALITDNANIIEQLVQTINLFEVEENISFLDSIKSVNALVDVLEKFNMTDLSKLLLALIQVNETVQALDKPPRKAISDLYIGNAEDGTGNTLLPFDMKINWAESLINFMPEIKNTMLELPNTDGGLIQDTVYGTRNFSITAYSENGMTTAEKQLMANKIANSINNIKQRKAKLTIGNAGISFDVKPTGLSVIESTKGQYIKLSMDLISENSYGYRQFEKEFTGSTLLSNDGITDVGVRIEVIGEVAQGQLFFNFGTEYYLYNAPLLKNEKLVIDTTENKYIVKKFNANNELSNQKINLIRGDLSKLKISYLTGTNLIVNPVINNQFNIYYREQFLWGTSTEAY